MQMEAAQEASKELKKTHRWLDDERMENARLAHESAAQVEVLKKELVVLHYLSKRTCDNTQVCYIIDLF